MSSGSYYEEEMSSGGHRRLTAFILWPFSPSKKSPLDPPSPWGWLGAYIDYTEIVWISICTLYDSQLNTLSRTEKYGQSKPAFLYQCATSSVLKNHCCSFSPSKLQKEELLYLLYSDFPV